ncbi:MAG: class II glutamine amidotransferase [Rubrivivax sp.]
MCRLAAYLGQPLFLEELIAKPRHSLMRQSLHADRAKMQTNGDGFGIGWYGDRDEPGVYREVMPAWSDDNLLALSQTLRSRLFFAHVRAATAGGIARQNCHPFRHGRYLFMHNGQIGGYAQLRRTLECMLPDELFATRRGATDSELLFLLALARIERGAEMADAVLAVLRDVAALMHERDLEAALRFTAVLSDGDRLIAFRIASDGQPPSLFLRRCERGTIVASEPLCDAQPGWEAVPANSVLVVDRQGASLARVDALLTLTNESAATGYLCTA